MSAAPPTTELVILGRLFTSGKKELSPQLARYILGLGFTMAEQARMRDLADRNQAGPLTPEEGGELLGYVKASHVLALLHSKARKALRKKKVS